jgi:redox-sensitive bicupin YhaK (pirin superfamily)
MKIHRKDFIKKAAAFGVMLVAGKSNASNLIITQANKKMKKQVVYKTRGHRADIGPIEIYRLISNKHVDHIGHFVFLDYIPPFVHKTPMKVSDDFAHPHRGIATLSYILTGEEEHFDSIGNYEKIHSGDVLWMKSGNGIVHNGTVNPDSKIGGKLMHGFQFWINLPAKHKKENPEIMALQSEELPLLQLPDNAGTLKVVIGEDAGQASKIPTYAKQYLYHIKINTGKTLTLPTEGGLEYAAFLPQHDLTINDTKYHSGDLVGFDDKEGDIEFINHSEYEIEFILFGGEKYTEPYVAHGPYVMNTRTEIQEAHNDYMSGKYGKIKYS